MIKQVFVYSPKRLAHIDENHKNDKLIYAEPRFYNKPEYGVSLVYTNSARIRCEYENDGVEVRALSEPVQDVTDPYVENDSQEPVVSSDAEDWRSLTYAKRKALCMKLTGNNLTKASDINAALEAFYAQ